MKKSPRLLSAFMWKSTPRHRAVTTCNTIVRLMRPRYRGVHRFVIGDSLIATLSGDVLIIYEGYASDLCSPAVRIGKWWVGTPTSKREALAAVVHDVTRQILAANLPCVPWNRKDTDDFFFEFLTESGSWFSRTYHRAVSGLVGSLFMILTAKQSDLYCEFHPRPKR